MTNKSAAAFLLVGAVCLTLMPTLTSAAEFANCGKVPFYVGLSNLPTYGCYFHAIFLCLIAANETAIGKYTQVEVSNCADSDNSCVLKRNSNATISITFTSGKCMCVCVCVYRSLLRNVQPRG